MMEITPPRFAGTPPAIPSPTHMAISVIGQRIPAMEMPGKIPNPTISPPARPPGAVELRGRGVYRSAAAVTSRRGTKNKPFSWLTGTTGSGGPRASPGPYGSVAAAEICRDLPSTPRM